MGQVRTKTGRILSSVELFVPFSLGTVWVNYASKMPLHLSCEDDMRSCGYSTWHSQETDGMVLLYSHCSTSNLLQETCSLLQHLTALILKAWQESSVVLQGSWSNIHPPEAYGDSCVCTFYVLSFLPSSGHIKSSLGLHDFIPAHCNPPLFPSTG